MKKVTKKYRLVCGLEIHVELATNAKMFCGCQNDPFHAPAPNTYTCPTCLGLPGALPVANRRAVEWTIKFGLALGCNINLFSKFDRKHYSYPDLAKGYQISQYDLPFCYHGAVQTSQGKVALTRIHLEEDTGKLIHQTIKGKKVSLVDFNRSGVPLMEIVSEPDIQSAAQAAEYGKKIRQLVRYLGFSQANMEQGEMRLEANISLSTDSSLPDYKVEVKNINSFKFLEQAINYEIERQTRLLDQGITPKQETRGWDHRKNETFAQRSKENAADYRYFPDPDLPPIKLTEKQIADWRKELPLLPDEIQQRWREKYQLNDELIKQLLTGAEQVKKLNRFFSKVKKSGLTVNKVAQAIVNQKFAFDYQVPCSQLIARYRQAVATTMIDQRELEKVAAQLMQRYPDEVKRYQAGEKKLIGFFLGQMKASLPQKVNMSQVKQVLENLLQSQVKHG